ncbi:MAG: hypothetical protein JWQ38_896 [Flavipsychrobacter sp.]|nr:hypothetical protein [Flavipsychrobacter sp.]
METLANILLIFEVIACLVGLFKLNKLKKTYWVYFPFYLLFIIVCELIGWYLSESNMLLENGKFFNYFEIPIEFGFMFWLFHQTFKNSKFNKLAVICAAIYFVCWIVDGILLNIWHTFFYSFSYTVANLVLLILLLTYFIRLVFSDAILTFRKDMMFWVSLGMLMYYMGSFPYYGLRNTLARDYYSLYVKYSYLEYILNCTMYLMFTFSFIWGKPNTRSL